MWIHSYINTSGNSKNEKFSENTTPISTSVDKTVYLYGKNVLYFLNGNHQICSPLCRGIF